MTPGRIVLVDHRDSFTWNLVHALGELAGTAPAVVDSATLDPEEVLAGDGAPLRLLLLGPGPGHPGKPGDAGRSLAVAAGALARGIPLFGVCFGLQLLAVAAGGRVVAAPAPVHGKPSRIDHDGTGLFAGLPRPATMMRYHSLVAERASLPPSWRVTATAEAGEVMAITHVERPAWAVQFHPESIGSPDGARLLANVLALADSAARTPA